MLVVDDQSSPAQELPEVRPDNTRLIRVEDGWGRANACHLGALAAEGDVLHWYDADMLAYREEVEAHARWHHLVDYAVPGGDKRFVDPAPCSAPIPRPYATGSPPARRPTSSRPGARAAPVGRGLLAKPTTCAPPARARSASTSG